MEVETVSEVEREIGYAIVERANKLYLHGEIELSNELRGIGRSFIQDSREMEQEAAEGEERLFEESLLTGGVTDKGREQ